MRFLLEIKEELSHDHIDVRYLFETCKIQRALANEGRRKSEILEIEKLSAKK